MKKKLVVLITALVMVFACALGLVACGSFDEGTYEMYVLTEVDGEKYAVPAGGIEFEFKGGEVKVAGIKSGEYEVSGDTLTLKAAGQTLKLTKKDNYWTATDEGETIAYIKKGETPKGYEVKSL